MSTIRLISTQTIGLFNYRTQMCRKRIVQINRAGTHLKQSLRQFNTVGGPLHIKNILRNSVLLYK